MSDKNQAVINYLAQCNQLTQNENGLYFNFIDAQDSSAQIITMSNDLSLNRRYIDGSTLKQYLFTLLIFKSISSNPIVTAVSSTPFSNENVEDMSAVQAVMDWINEQNDLHNFPSFGPDALVQSIETTTENPNLEGVNTESTPILGMYSFTIRIEYIDFSKKIWR